jgi:hypothetical protein
MSAPTIGNVELTSRVLVASLRSCRCPMCGGTKKAAQTLCGRDYYSLPRELQLALYRRLGSGYAEAVHAAFDYLGKTTFRTAEEAQAAR